MILQPNRFAQLCPIRLFARDTPNPLASATCNGTRYSVPYFSSPINGFKCHCYGILIVPGSAAKCPERLIRYPPKMLPWL
jgi:hypothetical protein